VSVDHLLLRFNIRHNVVLVTEVLLSLLVLYSTDTFSYYGNNIDYTKWSCGPPRKHPVRGQAACSNSTTNRTTFCESLYKDPTFSFSWDDGMEALFSTEFGMYCNREDESQTILDITGIGAGLGAFVGGVVGDLFGRKMSFKLSFLIILLSLITLSVCRTVQIFSLGLFLLGFSIYMSVTSIIVMVTEMLPYNLHYPFVILNAALTCLGIYLGCGLRLLIYNSWRAFTGCLLAFNSILSTLLVHLPLSPRYRVYQSTEAAKDTLHKLNIALFEDEQIEVPTDFAEDLKFDYKTNKRFLFTAFVLLYLKGVVAMTTTPSSGQVWTLLADKNIRYTVEASLRLLAVPLAGYLCAQNINLRSTVLVLGWITISCYFIGELPIGSGIFNINNIAGMMLIPVNRTLHIVILLLTLQIPPTCYRATVFGLSYFVEKCFLKLGALIAGIDNLPTTVDLSTLSEQSSYIHEYSFLVFGVIYLSFIYVASFLPTNTYRVLPGTVREFNKMYWPRRSEQAYLLTRYNPKCAEKDSDIETN